MDTSMGVSPLEGVMMQTRSGDIDPAIVLMLARSGMSIDEIDHVLNRESGAFAIGGDADMLVLSERSGRGDANATFAREMYAYRVQKYVSGYASVAWPLDAVVFTGGIGENDGILRAKICLSLAHLGIVLDSALNAGPQSAPLAKVSVPGAAVDVIVVKAGEEREIARQTMAMISRTA
jgi:acetate kinase